MVLELPIQVCAIPPETNPKEHHKLGTLPSQPGGDPQTWPH